MYTMFLSATDSPLHSDETESGCQTVIISETETATPPKICGETEAYKEPVTDNALAIVGVTFGWLHRVCTE